MQEKKVTVMQTLAVHFRTVRVLHKVNPGFFPFTAIYAVVSALTPYVTVFFSARILQELALLRREEVLWQWVIAGILCSGVFAVLTAILHRRYENLYDDLYERKEMLFSGKCSQWTMQIWTNRKPMTSGLKSNRMGTGRAGGL